VAVLRQPRIFHSNSAKEFCQKTIACDARLEQYLSRNPIAAMGKSAGRERNGKLQKKALSPQFDLHAHLFRMTGRDQTQIDGIDVRTAATVISEVGWGIEQVGKRGPIRFLAPAVLGQPNRAGTRLLGKGLLPRIAHALPGYFSSPRQRIKGIV
jgi:hypothetical protein